MSSFPIKSVTKKSSTLRIVSSNYLCLRRYSSTLSSFRIDTSISSNLGINNNNNNKNKNKNKNRINNKNNKNKTSFVRHYSTCGKKSFATLSNNNDLSPEEIEILNSPRETDNVDVTIVGGGVAGLAAAIRLKQLEQKTGHEIRVVVLEKGSEMGAHTLSGAVIQPTALDELIPDWRSNPPDPLTPVSSSSMKFLTKSGSIPLPEPPQMHNKGNYIVSLSQVVKWLSSIAEELGVEVYPGFSVKELLYEENPSNPAFSDFNFKSIKGIATNDMGISKTGHPKDGFQRGMEFHSRITLLAEGCHGSLSKQAITNFNLRGRVNADPQTYGIGIKEVWQIDPALFTPGKVVHSVGYPLNNSTYGGGFLYHFGENLVSLGIVLGLDYKNPYISPYNEFQKYKLHPEISKVLKNGKCISYGARALNEGGFQSIPHLVFPGGALIGCSAGFVNVPKIKGSHTAMKTGMLAAEAAFDELVADPSSDAPILLNSYVDKFKSSWVYDELKSVRNVRPSFTTSLGLYGGLIYSGLDTMILRGRAPWTFHHRTTDAAETKPASGFSEINYPKPDGKLTFDLMTSVARTGTMHDDNEPVHLKVADWKKHAEISWPKYKGIEARFCPAGVYEYIDDGVNKLPRFQINSQNCIHCKTCDIKVPSQDITWTCPEGGDGPKYFMT